MIALVDTNVVLDVMLGRELHLAASSAVLAAVETGRCRGLLCATTITTIHYIAGRQIGEEASLERIAELMSIFGVAAVNQAVLATALARDMPDFEDAVMHDAAIQAGGQCIVTRNVDDFAAAEIPVYNPEQFIAALECSGSHVQRAVAARDPGLAGQRTAGMSGKTGNKPR